jgi:hypothetical protein
MISRKTKTKTKKKSYQEYIIGDVSDNASYSHFKSLLKRPASKTLCNGKTAAGKSYKVHISLVKDYDTLVKTQNHYRLLYVYNQYGIKAYIAVKLYNKDGGYMFIHKVCSSGGGWGTHLMNMILDDARANYQTLGITYLSLTTHNLDLVKYYQQFEPTRVIEINAPGSKAKIPKRVAYIIWQLSPDMPWYDYK